MITPKSQLLRRLKIVEGQLRGLQDMVVRDVYCIDIITQTSAVKRALSALEDLLMENHLNTCVVHQMQKGNPGKAIKEVLKVYSLKRK